MRHSVAPVDTQRAPLFDHVPNILENVRIDVALGEIGKANQTID